MLGYNQQALYCYSKVYSLDPTNVDALWDRASLAKEMNDLRVVSPVVLFFVHLTHAPIYIGSALSSRHFETVST